MGAAGAFGPDRQAAGAGMMVVMTIFDTVTAGEPPDEVSREYIYEADVEIIGGIAGRTRCEGCTGEPCPDEERNNADLACIECKDTGWVWVSV